MERGGKSRLIAGVLTLVVLVILILAGPAKALSISLTIPDTYFDKGDITEFTGSVNIEAGEYPNITQLVLKLHGPVDINCQFDIEGNVILGCSGITIQKLSSPSFDYGYGGFNEGALEYKFTLDTTDYTSGTYNTFLSAVINSEETEQQGADIIISPFNLAILSPQPQDYSTRFIDISVRTLTPADYIMYSDNGKTFRTLYRNTNSYTLTIGFEEGWHNLTVRAIFGNVVLEKNVTFFVDSISPNFISSNPDQNTILSSTFSIKYTEENLKSIKLHLDNGTNQKTVEKTNCPSGKTVSCVFSDVNLEEFNLQRISYWFELSDSVNTVTTGKKQITPDLHAPVLNVFSPLDAQAYSKWMLFNLTSDKKVELSYRNNLAFPIKYIRLCRDCSEYGFNDKRLMNFPAGQQSITFRAKDWLGRTSEKTVLFNVG